MTPRSAPYFLNPKKQSFISFQRTLDEMTADFCARKPVRFTPKEDDRIGFTLTDTLLREFHIGFDRFGRRFGTISPMQLIIYGYPAGHEHQWPPPPKSFWAQLNTPSAVDKAAFREMWQLACEEYFLVLGESVSERQVKIQRAASEFQWQYWEKQWKDPAYIRWQESIYRAWQVEYIIPAAFFGAALAVLYIGVWWPT